MDILKKHKTNGIEGFHKFVRNLEAMSTTKRLEILRLASLEDPVYSMWVMKNIYDINLLFKVGKDYFPDIFELAKDKLDIFIKAFFESDLEERFLKEFLHEKYHPLWVKEVKYAGAISIPEKAGARQQIIEWIRELQEDDVFRNLKWENPPHQILNGMMNAPQSGPFKYFYDEFKQMIALEGNFEEGKREGIWRHFYPENKLMAEGYYHSGIKDEDWIHYYPDGSKWSKGTYKEDLREGLWTIWSRQGDESTVEFKRGKKA